MAQMPDAPQDMPADTGADMAPGDTGTTPDQGQEPDVLLTVLDNHDGTFTLYEGDEPEEIHGGMEEGAEGEEAPPADMGSAPEGQSFDGPGPLLAAILKIVRTAEESASGEGSAQDNFQAGFEGNATPSNTQKY